MGNQPIRSERIAQALKHMNFISQSKASCSYMVLADFKPHYEYKEIIFSCKIMMRAK